MAQMNEHLREQVEEWELIYRTKGELPSQGFVIKRSFCSWTYIFARGRVERDASYLLALKRAQKGKEDSFYYLLLEQAGALAPDKQDIQRKLEIKEA